MAWREELHPRDSRGRFTHKGSAPAVSISKTLASLDDVGKVSDDDLFDVFHRLSSGKRLSVAKLTRISAEMARREGLPKLPPPDPDAQAAKIDDLVRRGYDYAEAFTEAYGRSGGGQMIERQAGETTAQAQRRAYRELVALEALQAEEATRGHLLSKKCPGADVAKLWSASPDRARRCASEELQRSWHEHGGRKTYSAFTSMLSGSRAPAAAGSRGDFGI